MARIRSIATVGATSVAAVIAAVITGRRMFIAGLIALALVAVSFTAIGGTAQAAEPTAVFYGYIVPDTSTGALPKRIRAISEQGVVCGSADVVVTGNTHVGFYALPVVPASVKDGCPTAGETVRFALVYGMIDESGAFGLTGVFRPGEPIEHHLFRVVSAAVSSVSSPALLP